MILNREIRLELKRLRERVSALELAQNTRDYSKECEDGMLTYGLYSSIPYRSIDITPTALYGRIKALAASLGKKIVYKEPSGPHYSVENVSKK